MDPEVEMAEGTLDAAVQLLTPEGERVQHVHPAVIPELDVDQLIAESRHHLAAYKVPRRIVIVDELPRSTIGKILRGSVRAQLLERIGDAG